MELLKLNYTIKLHDLNQVYQLNAQLFNSKFIEMAREVEFNKKVLKEVHRSITQVLMNKGEENNSVGKIKERLTQMMIKTDYENFKNDQKF